MNKSEVPQNMKVQLARLFGENSKEAKVSSRTPTQWKHTLNRVLDELSSYLENNIQTDELHQIMLHSGIFAARESLKEDDFWPGYSEGIARLAFLLMGDYPDHRKRKSGKKTNDHYKLDLFRSIHYSQDSHQKFRTLLLAWVCGFPELSKNPRDALREFRELHGYKTGYKEFFLWYRKTYPDDYSKIF